MSDGLHGPGGQYRVWTLRGCDRGIIVRVKMWWVLSDVSPVQHQNFEESQEAMKQQLLQLSVLLKTLDPELYDFLGRCSQVRIGGRRWRRGC